DVDRDESGGVFTMINVVDPLFTCLLQLGKAGILGSQVDPGGDQISFSDFHCVFYSTLGCWVIRHTRMDRRSIPTGSRDNALIAHRQVTHMVHGYGFLVISQHRRWHSAQGAETGV